MFLKVHYIRDVYNFCHNFGDIIVLEFYVIILFKKESQILVIFCTYVQKSTIMNTQSLHLTKTIHSQALKGRISIDEDRQNLVTSIHPYNYLKSLNSKTDVSIFINLRYLRLKLLKNKENNMKICHIFHHNFKNIPCYVMSEVSLKRFYFALFDDGLTLKTLKLAFIGFLIQTLHL